jgi:hypothetical protein
MSYFLLPFSSWSIGLLNGFNKDSNPLDNTTKYGILVTTQIIGTIRAFNYQPLLFSTFTGIFIGNATMIGSIYCTGHLLGKAIKHTVNDKNRIE